MHVYLASTSPRRRDLLARARVDFTCIEPGPEPAGSGAPAELARLRARSKCLGAHLPPLAAPGVVLGVDTVVDLDGQELGKPVDGPHARRMLLQLAGREHAVHTAHCARLQRDGTASLFEEVTTARVFFRALDFAAIDAYLDSGEWAGKAGGYGIQGRASAFCVLLEGDLDTVIGLSVAAVRKLLAMSGP